MKGKRPLRSSSGMARSIAINCWARIWSRQSRVLAYVGQPPAVPQRNPRSCLLLTQSIWSNFQSRCDAAHTHVSHPPAIILPAMNIEEKIAELKKRNQLAEEGGGAKRR